MATKPTLANARFGETAGGSTAGAHLTTPSSGLRDTGFQPSTPAVSGYVNTLLHEGYLWFKYLDDGDLVGPIDITGDLNVTGDIDALDSGSGTGNIHAENNITADGNVTAGGYVSSDQNYFTATQTMQVPACAASTSAVSTTDDLAHALNSGGSWWVTEGNPNAIVYPIILPAGATIVGWTVYLNKTGGAQYNARLYRVTSAFAEDTMSLSAYSTSASGDTSISAGANPNVTMDSTSSYTLVVYPNSGSFTAGDKIGTAVISWVFTHP